MSGASREGVVLLDVRLRRRSWRWRALPYRETGEEDRNEHPGAWYSMGHGRCVVTPGHWTPDGDRQRGRQDSQGRLCEGTDHREGPGTRGRAEAADRHRPGDVQRERRHDPRRRDPPGGCGGRRRRRRGGPSPGHRPDRRGPGGRARAPQREPGGGWDPRSTGGSDGILVTRGATSDLRNCAVQGNGRIGVVVSYGATATVDNCLIQNNGGGGLAAANSASLALTNSTVQGNTGFGVVGARNANVRVGQDLAGSAALGPVVIRGNTGNGLVVTENSAGILVGSTVENNGGTGVWVGGGSNG